MKFLFFLFILSFVSCKSDEKKPIVVLNNNPEKLEKEKVIINSDTTPFIHFFERFILEKEFQEERNINKVPQDLIFKTSKDFIPFLNSDTLSLFDVKTKGVNQQGLIVVKFKENKSLKYSFQEKESNWVLKSCKNISNNKISEKIFIDFLRLFSEDSIYQKEHVLFPLKEYSLNNDYETVSQDVNKESWKHFNLINEIEDLIYLTNIDSKNVFRNIYYRGISNGIMIKFTFKRIQEEWYLVKAEDYST